MEVHLTVGKGESGWSAEQKCMQASVFLVTVSTMHRPVSRKPTSVTRLHTAQSGEPAMRFTANRKPSYRNCAGSSLKGETGTPAIDQD